MNQISNDKLYYLASPYTHLFKKIRQQRFEAAVDAVGKLIKNHNVITYSPIASMHPVAQVYELPTDFKFWKKHCTLYLSRCDGLIVLLIDGWAKSKGVMAEIVIAKKLGLPVLFYDPKYDVLTDKKRETK